MIPKPSKKPKQIKKVTKQQVQILFNRWIRQRDSDDGTFVCISCQKQLPIDKMTAGHFVDVGQNGFLRFHEDNVHGQCIADNVWKHGNKILYRINLVKKIGEERVKFLEDNIWTIHKYTQEELIKLKQKYTVDKR